MRSPWQPSALKTSERHGVGGSVLTGASARNKSLLLYIKEGPILETIEGGGLLREEGLKYKPCTGTLAFKCSRMKNMRVWESRLNVYLILSLRSLN